MAGCVTAVYALSFFTAAIRLVSRSRACVYVCARVRLCLLIKVTALFEALRPQLDSAAGPAINAEELKAGVIHALAVSVLEAGVPAVARLVTDETAKAIAGSPVGLPDAVDMPAIERFFHGVLRVRTCVCVCVRVCTRGHTRIGDVCV